MIECTHIHNIIISRPSNQPRRSVDARFDINEIKNACLLINTSEYCQITASEVISFLVTQKILSDMIYSSKTRWKIRLRMNLKKAFPSRRNVIFSLGMAAILPSLFYYFLRFFSSVVASAIQVLQRELESACDPVFEAMARTLWGSISSVSGPSAYIADLSRTVEQVVDMVNSSVEQKKYLRNFHDKAVAWGLKYIPPGFADAKGFRIYIGLW